MTDGVKYLFIFHITQKRRLVVFTYESMQMQRRLGRRHVYQAIERISKLATIFQQVYPLPRIALNGELM